MNAFNNSGLPKNKPHQQLLNVNAFLSQTNPCLVTKIQSGHQQQAFGDQRWSAFEQTLIKSYSHFLNFVGSSPGVCHANSPVDTRLAYELLSSSMLPRNTLSMIWSMVNKTIPGQLTVREFCFAIALVAIAQKYPQGPLKFENLYYLTAPPNPVFSIPVRPIGTQRPENVNGSNCPSTQATSIQSDDFGDFTTFDTPSGEQSKRTNDLGTHACLEAEIGGASILDSKIPPSISSTLMYSQEDATTKDKVVDSEPHINCWLSVIKAVLDIVTNASNLLLQVQDSVLKEVLNTEQGYNYMLSLNAAMEVANRVFRASQTYALSSASLTVSYGRVHSLWLELVNKVTAVRSGLDFLRTEYGATDTNEEKTNGDNCALCLQVIHSELQTSTTRTTALNSKGSSLRIEFRRMGYHAQCANLWVNCVDSLLPGLTTPELL